MFGLSLLYLTISSTSISFLSTAFVFSSIVCDIPDYDFPYNHAYVYTRTYHEHHIPEGATECMITASGQGFVYPSIFDNRILRVEL